MSKYLLVVEDIPNHIWPSKPKENGLCLHCDKIPHDRFSWFCDKYCEDVYVAENLSMVEKAIPWKKELEEIELPWVKLGCKNCFKECSHFKECMTLLSDRVRMREVLREPVFQD